jgi:hypothetical protein
VCVCAHMLGMCMRVHVGWAGWIGWHRRCCHWPPPPLLCVSRTISACVTCAWALDADVRRVYLCARPPHPPPRRAPTSTGTAARTGRRRRRPPPPTTRRCLRRRGGPSPRQSRVGLPGPYVCVGGGAYVCVWEASCVCGGAGGCQRRLRVGGVGSGLPGQHLGVGESATHAPAMPCCALLRCARQAESW